MGRSMGTLMSASTDQPMRSPMRSPMHKPMHEPIHAPAGCQRGITLLEALVAFLVLTLGMLAVMRVQGQLRLNAETARHRSEAVRLAQDDLESLRAFSVLAAAPGVRSYEAIASTTRTVGAGDPGDPGSTAFVLTRQVDAAGALAAKQVVVSVRWNDRSGAAQEVTLASVIAGVAPAYSGALGLARNSPPVQGALGRSARIPIAAKDLGDGRSAFKPVGGGSVALMFDKADGRVTGRCAAVASNPSTGDLTAKNLGPCDVRVGLLLSGTVRFTSGLPPNRHRRANRRRRYRSRWTEVAATGASAAARPTPTAAARSMRTWRTHRATSASASASAWRTRTSSWSAAAHPALPATRSG